MGGDRWEVVMLEVVCGLVRRGGDGGGWMGMEKGLLLMGYLRHHRVQAVFLALACLDWMIGRGCCGGGNDTWGEDACEQASGKGSMVGMSVGCWGSMDSGITNTQMMLITSFSARRCTNVSGQSRHLITLRVSIGPWTHCMISRHSRQYVSGARIVRVS